jgi:serine phosphatase RsbU (regulator of sigma subunit)
VELLGDQNLPIGVFSDTPFQSTRLEVCTGDVLAIITDGLTEVFNRREEELGIEDRAQTLSERSAPLDR